MISSFPAVDLREQVAIVTGGGRGLGKAMALRLAQAGASVVVAGRALDALEETAAAIHVAGGTARAIPTDVTSQADVDHLARKVEQELGRIDTLVNNAGVVGTPGPTAQADPDAWWQVMNVNVRGAFLCARAVLPGMIQRKSGQIINIVSSAAVVNIPFATSYCASKAALVRFTDCLAVEVSEDNVSAFAVDPGTVRTAMAEYLLNSDEGKTWVPWFSEIFEQGRDMLADPVADLVTFLACGQAKGLTGRFIGSYDDLAEMLQKADHIRENDLYMMRLRRL